VTIASLAVFSERGESTDPREEVRMVSYSVVAACIIMCLVPIIPADTGESDLC
jgi:hypothetical protein